ncbi:MAG: acetyl-CoA acetyltransferase [Actinomycetota bacterium]|nr:acetyl-CoA acetyltransferase [Actinomycetota bacterium]
MTAADPVPVIVGAGYVTRHPTDLDATTEPAELIATAIEGAATDAGVGPAARAGVDSLDVLNLLSWKYADPAGTVAGRIDAQPARSAFSDLGGEQPTALIDAAARRIQHGESAVAVIAGGETLASRRMWGKAGQEPPWSPRGEPPVPLDPFYGLRHGLAEAGLGDPTQVYPLMENARRAAMGLTLEESQAASGRIWAAMSEVASRTPGAWVSEPVNAGTITNPSAANRPIAHPYLKLMCAQPMVDQAAAVMVTSTDHARRMGIPEDRWVYPWAGAGAVDTTEVLERPSYAASEPMCRSILDALALVGLSPDRVDALELYSCFPIVPKLALEALGRADTTTCTVAGGLTFYGGPLNAYMLCATAHMVHALRERTGTGLLYGNGGYLTKHHTLIVGTDPPPRGHYRPDERTRRQAALDRRKGPIVASHPAGPATVETYTVVYDRSGVPERAVVIGRLDDARRFVARVPPDADVLAWLVSGGDQPVGRTGTVAPDPDDQAVFTFA